MFSYIWKNKKKKDGLLKQIEFPVCESIHIDGIMPLLWREHCIECAMPLCYSTCPLYVPRRDKRCLRFEYGIVPQDFKDVIGADISFKRWAKLESNLSKIPVAISLRKNNLINKIFDFLSVIVEGISTILLPILPNRRLSQIFAHYHESFIKNYFYFGGKKMTPEYFLVQFYYDNHEEKIIQLEFIQKEQCRFRASINAKYGWNTYKFPFSSFNYLPLVPARFKLWIESDINTRIIFKWLDFTNLNGLRSNDSKSLLPAKQVKCIAWDLDNTLWFGVIGDVGKDNVVIRQEALKLIMELDERGIIQTIVSKNTFDVAWEKIKDLKLDDYFLYPAINWGRKSQSLISIAKELNINIDTFAVIDDSDFEREEIKRALPQVRVYDPHEIETLLSKEEFDISINEFSRNRRLSYLAEYKRKNIVASWEGDYDSFLQSCHIELEVFEPDNMTKERCLELLQRSNQYNLSTKRYSQMEFDSLLANRKYECFAFRVKDQYGNYGIVGFVSIYLGNAIPIIKDFVMSCRVAQKRIEEAFIHWYIDKNKSKKLEADIIMTERNRPLFLELQKIGFVIKEECENMKLLYFKNTHTNIGEIVKVVFND